MKKYLLAFFLCCTSAAAFAYGFEVGNLRYTVISRAPLAVELTTVAGDVPQGELVLPERVQHEGKTYKVQAVASRAFAQNLSLVSLTVPATITEIGDSAFYGCSGLKYLVVGDGDTPLSLGYNRYTGVSEGEALFHDCPLKTLYLGRELRYKEGFFYGYSPFYKKARLSLVIVGDKVKKVESRAFYGCEDLTTVTIGGGVETIENYAFSGCSALKELIIKEGKKPLFVGRNKLMQNIFYDSPLETLYLGRDLTYEENIAHAYNPFYKKETLRNVTIGDAATELPPRAFYGCRSLVSLKVGGNVRKIGNGAFAACAALRELYLADGDSVLYLGANARAAKTMGEGLFADCPLETLYVGRSLDYSTSYFDGYSPFYGQSKLHDVVIGERVAFIGDRLFAKCENLVSVTVGGNVEIVGNYVFKECSQLSRVVLHDGVKPLYMGYNRVQKSGIGESLFSDCRLKTLYLGRDLDFNASRFYGYSPFYKQASLSSLTIGGRVSRLAQNLFSHCSGLTSITIPASVAFIGDAAFSECTSVVKLTFEDGTQPLAVGSSYYRTTDETLFQNVPVRTLYLGRDLQYPAGADAPFAGNVFLQSVEAGATVTALPDGLFKNCTSLESLTVGGRVERIGDRCVQGCTRLRTLVFRDGDAPLTLGCNDCFPSGGHSLFFDAPIQSLYLGRELLYPDAFRCGYSPFYRKETLAEVTIGKTVTAVGSRLFYGCSRLDSLTVEGRLDTVGTYAFYGCPAQP